MIIIIIIIILTNICLFCGETKNKSVVFPIIYLGQAFCILIKSNLLLKFFGVNSDIQ